MQEINSYVLMLENDSDDRYFTESTLKELSLNIPIKYTAYNEMLLNTFSDSKPSLILLAYNCHPHTCMEILSSIRLNTDFAHIPVVVLSEDISGDYVREYYRLGANSVIKKPSSIALTRHKVQTFFNYWFGVAEL